MKDNVRVNRSLTIPGDEIDLSFSTSGGPGGQHANKASTRAELTWNVATSRAVGPRQRERIRSALRSRIDSSGALRITADTYRSQSRNRDAAVERLRREVAVALRPVKKRRPTRPTAASKERRLEQKRHRSRVKKLRRETHDV